MLFLILNKFNKNTKYIISYNLLVLSLLFVGCSAPKHNKSYHFEKAMVFYASDDPLWLPHFSNAFTRRISAEGIFEAIQNNEFNKQWLANSLGNKLDVNLEITFIHNSNKIQEYIKNNQLLKARKYSIACMKEAVTLLSNNPSSVSFAYATLAFWSAVANLNLTGSNSIAQSYALIYEKYSSFSIKDSLEAQVELKIVDKLKEITASFLVKQKSIKILNSKNCTVFVDGQELKSATISLPFKMQSVISASCKNGSFSRVFTADKYSSIKISPYLSSTFYNMPSPSVLPKEQILAEHPAVILLIFWSHSGMYIDSYVINSKNFSVVKKTRILLSSKKDLDEAGDNLIAFLKSIVLPISKNSFSGLTSSLN